MPTVFPNLDITKDVLFVNDDNYITSAGSSKPFEAVLYLCQYLYETDIVKSLAGGLVIDWDAEKAPHFIIND